MDTFGAIVEGVKGIAENRDRKKTLEIQEQQNALLQQSSKREEERHSLEMEKLKYEIQHIKSELESKKKERDAEVVRRNSIRIAGNMTRIEEEENNKKLCLLETSIKKIEETLKNLQFIQMKDLDNDIYVPYEDADVCNHIVCASDETCKRLYIQQREVTLKVESGNIIVANESKSILGCWSIENLRRFGYSDSTFYFEAGRKSELGPGQFSFSTDKGKAIQMKVVQEKELIRRPGESKEENVYEEIHDTYQDLYESIKDCDPDIKLINAAAEGNIKIASGLLMNIDLLQLESIETADEIAQKSNNTTLQRLTKLALQKKTQKKVPLFKPDEKQSVQSNETSREYDKQAILQKQVVSSQLSTSKGCTDWSPDSQIIQILKGEQGLGLIIYSEVDPLNPHKIAIRIKSIKSNSVAHKDGRLSPGDRLEAINGVLVDNGTFEYAVTTLKGVPKGIVSLCIRKLI